MDVQLKIIVGIVGVWIVTAFTIRFDYDYHVNDSI